MTALAIYCLAALGEISGCFAFWAWLRLQHSVLWVIPGMLSLAAFALLLTRIDVQLAGRAFAAYGGVYIAASLLWLWVVEGQRPDGWDMLGAALATCAEAVTGGGADRRISAAPGDPYAAPLRGSPTCATMSPMVRRM